MATSFGFRQGDGCNSNWQSFGILPKWLLLQLLVEKLEPVDCRQVVGFILLQQRSQRLKFTPTLKSWFLLTGLSHSNFLFLLLSLYFSQGELVESIPLKRKGHNISLKKCWLMAEEPSFAKIELNELGNQIQRQLMPNLTAKTESVK